jgi:hypothetical protein
MLSVTYKPFMLSVIVLIAIMLGVVVPLSGVMLSPVKLCVVMLNVIMLI